MAIQYVGGVSGSRAGATSTTTQSLSGTLSGGLDTSPSQGDLVLVTVAVGSSAGYTPSTLAVDTYTPGTLRSQTGVTNYSYLQHSYKFMSATPDTSITIPSAGNIRNAQTWTVQVFRGVDGSVYDTTTIFATGTATGRPDPGAITPSTAGAWIIWLGASAAGTGSVFTAPSGFSTNWLNNTQADTYDSMIGAGYYTGWTSGSYNPAAVTAGGTTGATDSWVAETIALKALTVFDADLSDETVTLTDTISINTGKNFSEDISITDSKFFDISKGINDYVGITEVIGKDVSKEGLIETVGASDYFSYELIQFVPSIVLRSVKGSPLTFTEFDDNFNYLNTAKLQRVVNSITSSASITPVKFDYYVTALAETAVINAPSGTPSDGQQLLLRIKDNGTSQGISWNAIYRALGFTLPTATTIGTTMYIGAIYNSADMKWDVVAYTTIT